MITVYVGFEVDDWNIQVEETKEFDNFNDANRWSTEVMAIEGYDTAQFRHSEGEEVMTKIIEEYLGIL